MSLDELTVDGKRQMQICNACRYCEGYCAVWRAIEWRREFSEGDMAYLANLCHDCRECYFACPFTTPHEFDINPPKLFGSLREELYRRYAWPNSLTKALGSGRRSFWIVSIIGLLVLLSIIFLTNGAPGLLQRHVGTGAFYKVISEGILEALFGVLAVWLITGWIVGASRFWKDTKRPVPDKVAFVDLRNAALYALRLRFLGREPIEENLHGNRKWLHHLVFYGFLLDFASTTLAAVYSHLMGIQAPYGLYSPVVILGVLGGLGIIIGTSGLLYLHSKSDSSVAGHQDKLMGNAFSISLLMVALTGMSVLALRDTSALGIILAIHLSTVASLFFTAPYSKFVHFIYRYLALIRFSQEERLATRPLRRYDKY